MARGLGRLAGDVASSLDAVPELLPLLPELLADLDDLGGSPGAVVALLRAQPIERRMRALDLGCGKGGVSIALARELGLRVRGVDAMEAFVREARERAAREGVESSARFEKGDLRAELRQGERYDVAVLSGLGPVLGPPRTTVGALRRIVRPGGWIVIDDAYLAPGAAERPGYLPRPRAVRELTAHGDELVGEERIARDETRASDDRNTARIRDRARELARRRPDLAKLAFAYVERQEEASATLRRELVPVALCLRRAPLE
ncbi:MAG TPA: class I SAM-dependent methyltransferase [Planctomycetota bacterium]|nr:class I SAM-dependent methyltransferase [Planctomycetota bacterium]